MFNPTLIALLLLALTASTLYAQATQPRAGGGPEVEAAHVTTREVRYTHEGTELVGYLAYPRGFDRMDMISHSQPAVLVLPEWWGLTEYPKMRARQLASLGYVAFAADMYGGGKTTDDPEQAKKWAGPFYGDRDLLRGRAAAGLEAMLKDQGVVDPERVVAIGYCFGGTAALDLAYSGAELAGVVTIHGGVQTPRKAAEAEAVKGEVLILHGNADSMVEDDTLDTITTALTRANRDWTLIRYSGAKHAFTNPDADSKGMDAVGYDERAARRSWEHMRVFLEGVLTPTEE